MSDQKTSLLINRQVPEFIRDEYPLFITFLEAYYEYLETKQGTQLNDLTQRAKDLKHLSDIDSSIDDFEQNFLSSYASLVPKDTSVDKAFLIKNILPLYLAKGSENSFKLLFRMIFGGEVEVSYPRSDVLRASDGKWTTDTTLKVSTDDIYSTYTGDGLIKEFKLIQEYKASDLNVYIDGVLQTTGYFVRKEIKKLVFTTAPANNSIIKVLYPNNFDNSVFLNRKITGKTSGASAIIESVTGRIVDSVNIIELFINEKNYLGDFLTGEEITLDIIDSDDDIINIVLETVSSFLTISIINSGSSYNIGDPVQINTSGAKTPPKAIVSSVFNGLINNVIIYNGGSGFEANNRIAAIGYAQTDIDFVISEVNTLSSNTSNTFVVMSNIINDIDPSNTLISAANYSLPSNIAETQNVNTIIARALSNTSYLNIGEISNVFVAVSNIAVSSPPTLNAEPSSIIISGNKILIDTFGSLGAMQIVSGGTGYSIGDELVFTNKPMSFGLGAEAEVTGISVVGGNTITQVSFVPSKITGTANVTSTSNVMVEGTGTVFQNELSVGDIIKIGSDSRKVTVITSNTSLNVNTASWTSTYTDKPIRLWGKNLIGGQGYTQNKLPSVSIISANGSGANVIVTGILGDGENLLATGTRRPGEIERIQVIESGKGYTGIPTVDLTNYGDGTATANASYTPTFQIYDGRWITSDSILSSIDRKLQGRDYYVDYSYLTSSTIEFAKYKRVFKELLHPTGFKAYGQWQKLTNLINTEIQVNQSVLLGQIPTLSGTVNVNNSIIVIGTGTKFNVANTLEIITIGSYIAVNSEIRLVNNIISNTQLTVTVPFTFNANVQEMVVVNTVYSAASITTELDEEIITETGFTLIVES